MKKRMSVIIALMLLLMCVFVLASCDNATPPSKAILTSTSLTVSGKNISGTLSYATDHFNFANDIAVTSDAPWVVSIDSYGMQTVVTKTVALSEGNNTFYIHVTNPDQTVDTYTVNLYRNHLYTVQFHANGGTGVKTQYVEEGYLATEPSTTRVGYTFVSWDYNFTMPITANMTISANWSANGNTPYKVEYYLENVAKNGYDLVEAQNLTGTTDTTAYAEQKVFDHFTLNINASTMTGNIDGDGALILKGYYTRNTYTVSSSDTSIGSITNAGSYIYKENFELTLTATKSDCLGYVFLGWYSGEELLSRETEYTAIIDKNIVAKFDSVPEMQNFIFSSTSTTCSINGIKNKGVTEIIIPDFVTSIGGGAFSDCTSLVRVTIPASVTSVGIDAFAGCTSLEGVYITSIEAWCKIRFYSEDTMMGYKPLSNPLFYAGNLYLNGELVTDLVIPGSVNSVSYYAFYGCTSLTSVTISNGVTGIYQEAFFCCGNLKSVTLPVSVTGFGYQAFCGITAYYKGTIWDWDQIDFGFMGEEWYFSKRYFYSETATTNGWRYVDGEPTPW